MPRLVQAATTFSTLSVLLLAACVPPSPYPPGMTQVCDDKGCTVRDPRIGTFVPKDEPGPAAAKSAEAQSAYNNGLAYFQGKGRPRDNTEAAKWFTIAAEAGVPEAQYDLGLLYYRGDGVPQQLYDALQWMRRSAQHGYLPAQVAVGRLYMTGLDTMGQDLTEARTWLTMAAGRGNADAKRWLDEVVKAQAAGEAQDQQLRLQQAQTATLWASAILAGALAPRPVYIYGY